jgi:hypothetical protein
MLPEVGKLRVVNCQLQRTLSEFADLAEALVALNLKRRTIKFYFADDERTIKLNGSYPKQRRRN